MRHRKLTAALAAVTLAGAGAVAVPAVGAADGPEAGAAGKKTPKIKVGDDYFAPDFVKVKKGSKVKFKWLPENGNPHNATLDKGPKGVKKKDFTSGTGSIGIKFNPKFKKKGTYNFICTIHPVMTAKVKVKG